MFICVSYKKQYGKELFYPESDDAKFFTSFTGRPTLTKKQLKLALDKGFRVKILMPKVKLNLEDIEDHHGLLSVNNT